MAYYPTALPGPTKSVHTPKARVSSPNLPGVGSYSARERDYSGMQDVEFFLDATQAAAWYTWWKTDLKEGGLWFNANWPALRPGFMTLQFITEPVFTHVYDGAHRIAATVQVRGASKELAGSMTGGTLPGTVYFGFVNVPDPVQTPSGDPLAARNALVGSLATYVTSTLWTASGGAAPSVVLDQFTPVPDYGPGTVTVSYVGGADVRIQTSPGLGRFNTSEHLDGLADAFFEASTTAATALVIDPSIKTFNAFGLYLTDPGDFLPSTYTFTVNTSVGGPYTPFFDLSSVQPTASGCLAFWGFILTPGLFVTSVVLNLGSPTDIVGIDDIIFGNT